MIFRTDLCFVFASMNMVFVLSSSLTFEESRCETPSCYAAVKILEYNMDRSVDPCDDFYQFACGGYLNKTKLGDAWFKNYFTVLDDKIIEIIHDLVSQPIGKTDHLPTVLMKQTYSLCNDLVKINESSVSSLLEVLGGLGGFPMLLDYWNQTDFSISKYLSGLLETGVTQNTLFTIRVFESDERKPQFQLYKADFADRRSMLSKGKITKKVQAYFDYMNETIVALGGNISKIKEDLQNILSFEMELAEIASGTERYDFPEFDEEEETNAYTNETSVNGTQSYNSTYLESENYVKAEADKFLRLKDLDEKFPGFPWKEYIQYAFSPYYNLTFEEPVDVHDENYYRWLSNLTKHTNNRTLINFLLWRMIDDFVPALPTHIQSIKRHYESIYRDAVDSRDRRETCLETIQDRFKVEVGYMFVKSFNKTYEKSARDIAEKIREVYIEAFKNATWMTNITKQAAIEKVSKMRFDISYPSSLDNITFLDEYYSDLTLQNESYLRSLLELGKFQRNKLLKNRFEKDAKVDLRFLESVAKAAAVYEADGNSMGIPSTLLREIFYAHNRTAYLNFGGVGTIMGYRIAQGFDEEGRMIDAKGLINNWWDNTTNSVYENRSLCFVEQYENMTREKIDETETLSTIIDDNFGVKEAYEAYMKWVQKHGREEKLPGLEYSTEQLFWTQYAATMCEVRLGDDKPKKFRVNLVLSNLKYFRSDWKCNLTSVMAPNHTCHLW